MAVLSQICGVSNSPRMTISMWVQRTVNATFCPLIQWGDSYDGKFLNDEILGPRRSGIEYRLMGGSDPNPFFPALVFTFAGPRDSLRVADCITGDHSNSVISNALLAESGAYFDVPNTYFVVGVNELEG